MSKLLEPFSRLRPKKILVIGDLLLDSYTIGKARRISPEAPVPVLHVQKEESRPGGAGNAILNMVSLGAKIVVIGRVGNDVAGRLILNELSKEGVDVEHVLIEEGYKTPLKNRIIADNQQIVRIDHEMDSPLSLRDELKILENIPLLMKDVRAVAISDYGKGFLTSKILKHIIEEAKKRQIIVIADPKGTDFTKYKGVFLLKPNLSEAYAAAHLPLHAPLDEVAKRVLEQSGAEYLMVTRSEAGISLFCEDGSRQDFPVKEKEVKDVTGAGDTVLAMIACALACDLPVVEAIPLSNVAAGIAIEHIGCARVSLSDLAKRLLNHDTENKVFETQHLNFLQFALKDKECISLSLASDILSKELIMAMHELKKNQRQQLIVSIESQEPHEEFIRALASLYQVDFIILNPTKKTLSHSLEFQASFAFKDHLIEVPNSLPVLL
ncbi:Bifunctional protein hldE [Chlamydiales bacterium STE3]|nr:Bifunctional protein hldE [Chlamydiales bacterium STE3]